jgi:hypothetical protein
MNIMKRTSLFLIALLLASHVKGGNDPYYEKMKETIRHFPGCSSPEDYQDLANRFRVIAKKETGEWLPLYYEAQCYILMGFTGQLENELRDSYLDKTAALIDKMLVLAPDEAEVYVMKSFFHTAYLVVDPPQRAMVTTPLIHQAIAQALAIEPKNPRALFLRLSNEMGTASYFGEDTSPYCDQAAELLDQWDNYKSESPIHPSWGKDDVSGIVNSCGE